jgi:hypothetical protein
MSPSRLLLLMLGGTNQMRKRWTERERRGREREKWHLVLRPMYVGLATRRS